MDQIPAGDEDQQSQIHYVYCLREIKQGWTSEQKQTLLAWFRKAKDWRGGASFPGFINRLFESSLEFFDEQERQAAYAAIPEYAPVDDEALLALLAPARRPHAAQRVRAQDWHQPVQRAGNLRVHDVRPR